jgi:hypothetical protein
MVALGGHGRAVSRIYPIARGNSVAKIDDAQALKLDKL